MAYNKSFNPDKLPAFAEPTRRNSTSTVPSDIPSRIQKPSPPPPLGQLPSYRPMVSSGNYRRSSLTSRPPATPPQAADTDRQALWPLFQAVDKDGSGQLTEKELHQALVNGDWSSFDPCTIKMMIRLFDVNRTGTINFNEFCGLWSFLGSWRSLFNRFDADNSGNISFDEYTNALISFGYRLSNQFVLMLFTKYDKRNEGAISFDLFVQSCIRLKRMTDIFKKYDDDRDGFITLSFEEFLNEMIIKK